MHTIHVIWTGFLVISCSMSVFENICNAIDTSYSAESSLMKHMHVLWVTLLWAGKNYGRRYIVSYIFDLIRSKSQIKLFFKSKRKVTQSKFKINKFSLLINYKRWSVSNSAEFDGFNMLKFNPIAAAG